MKDLNQCLKVQREHTSVEVERSRGQMTCTRVEMEYSKDWAVRMMMAQIGYMKKTEMVCIKTRTTEEIDRKIYQIVHITC
jgi:hypothetical protein